MEGPCDSAACPLFQPNIEAMCELTQRFAPNQIVASVGAQALMQWPNDTAAVHQVIRQILPAKTYALAINDCVSQQWPQIELTDYGLLTEADTTLRKPLAPANPIPTPVQLEQLMFTQAL